MSHLSLVKIFQEADNPEESSRDWEDEEHKVHGQLMGDLEDLTFFVAACYKGQVDLSYICLYSKQLHLRHAPVVSSDVHETMETAFSGAELQSTLYPTEPGLKRDGGGSEEPMFSVAAKFLLDPVKNIKVTDTNENTFSLFPHSFLSFYLLTFLFPLPSSFTSLSLSFSWTFYLLRQKGYSRMRR